MIAWRAGLCRWRADHGRYSHSDDVKESRGGACYCVKRREEEMKISARASLVGTEKRKIVFLTLVNNWPDDVPASPRYRSASGVNNASTKLDNASPQANLPNNAFVYWRHGSDLTILELPVCLGNERENENQK